MAGGRDTGDPREAAAARLRRLIPITLAVIIGVVVIVIATSPRSGRGVDATPQRAESPVEPAVPEKTTSVAKAAPEAASPTPAAQPAATTTSQQPDPRVLTGLHMQLHDISSDALPMLGGLEAPDEAHMQLQFTQQGAGIVEIPFANIWMTAAANRQAQRWFDSRDTADASLVSPPPSDERYVLARESEVPLGGQMVTIPLLAARSITVNGTELNLVPAPCWKPIGPGQFQAVVLNGAGDPILRIHRHWKLNGWDITLDQTLSNLSGAALKIRWSQYGPPNLEADRSRYMDRRRFRFGWLLGQSIDPDRLAGVVADGNMLLELADVTPADVNPVLWPNDQTREEGFELSWFASTNRYFAMAIHPLLDAQGHGDLSLENVVGEITRFSTKVDNEPVILTGLAWPAAGAPDADLAAGGEKVLSMGVYAGPLEQSVLADKEPYRTLNMQGLILYQMSSFCAFCTFQWLAHLLLAILAFFDHWVVFDWGVAIILLVLCVRGLLHPITRRSQMGMQKFGKQMQRLKPEMEKLQAKHAGDRRKMQEEQMRLFREHGVNPLQMLGCLPMFLQMPIWIALYAALYFSFDLRQQPAFWGIFQEFWGWPFLADLASPDHFFWEAPEPFPFLIWNITGINILPFLMGLIFFFQQKYMTPPTSMSPEQEMQQKIMRIMMVVLFPLMLYSAPSGLTLYILTSSAIGILESRHIRKQVDAMDLDAPSKKQRVVQGAARSAGGKAGKDPQARAYTKMMERRQQQKNRGPEKRFKKRK